jgi:hypothetical protein
MEKKQGKNLESKRVFLRKRVIDYFKTDKKTFDGKVLDVLVKNG